MNDWFGVQEVANRVWAIQEPLHEEEVISYLLEGDAEALLVDTGMGIGDIREVTGSLTRMPILVVNTHSHYDHVGGNVLFDRVAIHADEADRLLKGVEPGGLSDLVDPSAFRRPPPPSFDPSTYGIPPRVPARQLQDGDVIDLGGRAFEIIHTPGHSPGSICLWEKEARLLFTGDTVYKGPVYAQLPQSDFDSYLLSLRRLSSLVSQLEALFPAHGVTPIDPSFILELTGGFRQIAEGQTPCTYEEGPWGMMKVYTFEGFSILLK
jgi:glyoxylase-like metal-dependent hydrolase (beta-lactamase superfamily II)